MSNMCYFITIIKMINEVAEVHRQNDTTTYGSYSILFCIVRLPKDSRIQFKYGSGAYNG